MGIDPAAGIADFLTSSHPVSEIPKIPNQDSKSAPTSRAAQRVIRRDLDREGCLKIGGRACLYALLPTLARAAGRGIAMAIGALCQLAKG